MDWIKDKIRLTNPETGRPGIPAESKVPEATTATTTEVSHKEEAPREDTSGPDKVQITVHSDAQISLLPATSEAEAPKVDAATGKKTHAPGEEPIKARLLETQRTPRT